MVAVSLALFCIQLDFFALNLALPAMARAFHVGASGIQWTVSAYMLSLGSLFIVGGRVGDIFGRRRVLLGGIGVFGLASVACAAAPTLGALVAFRVLQGAGAAVIFPVWIAALSNEFSDPTRAKALGLAFGIANVGTALGPFVGGGLADDPGWRWIFWLLVPVCAVALGVAIVSVSESRDPAAPRKLDVPGALAVAIGVALLSVAADRGGEWGWASPQTLAAYAAALLALIAFLVLERRIRVPLVNLALVRNLPFVLVTGIGAVSNIGYAVTIFGVSLYLQLVRGLSPLTAGLVFLAPSALVAVSGPLGAKLGRHFRPTAVMAAAAVVSGSGLLALTFAHGWAIYIVAFATAGLGFGLGYTFANVATQDVVHPDRAGEASGVTLTILVSAGGIGVAAAAAAITLQESSGSTPHHAIDFTLRVVALAVLGAAIIVMVIRQELVRRGLMAPLSMETAWTPPPGHTVRRDVVDAAWGRPREPKSAALEARAAGHHRCLRDHASPRPGDPQAQMRLEAAPDHQPGVRRPISSCCVKVLVDAEGSASAFASGCRPAATRPRPAHAVSSPGARGRCRRARD